jgi:hypothetical protein
MGVVRPPPRATTLAIFILFGHRAGQWGGWASPLAKIGPFLNFFLKFY